MYQITESHIPDGSYSICIVARTSNLARVTFAVTVRRIKSLVMAEIGDLSAHRNKTCARITIVDRSDVIHVDSFNPNGRSFYVPPLSLSDV